MRGEMGAETMNRSKKQKIETTTDSDRLRKEAISSFACKYKNRKDRKEWTFRQCA